MIDEHQESQVITFGCRLNAYESEVIRQRLRADGLTQTIVINTCAVTNEAERQARQAIRKARREYPERRIVVTGCGAQINPNAYADMPEVDRVLGNIEKMEAQNYRLDQPTKVAVQDIMQARETASHLVSGFEGRVRAFLEIQNGCDHRCTFCAIPYGRGNNRSVPLGIIAQQVRALVEQGCKEVVFTGVDITGYGSDLPGQPTLGQMIRRVLAQAPGLPRLRLSSLDPAEVDDDVFRLLQEEPRLMPHLHISLQAGDDMILKRMKRRHLRDDVKRFCDRARQARSDIVFGCDIIAGFPTETDVMHENSLNLIEECDITYLHVFPFSPRQGTPAARMPQVPRPLIKERAARLRAKGQQLYQAYLQQWLAKEDAVLFENRHGGHSDHYAPVVLKNLANADVTGQVRSVRYAQIDGRTLLGELVEQG